MQTNIIINSASKRISECIIIPTERFGKSVTACNKLPEKKSDKQFVMKIFIECTK